MCGIHPSPSQYNILRQTKRIFWSGRHLRTRYLRRRQLGPSGEGQTFFFRKKMVRFVRADPMQQFVLFHYNLFQFFFLRFFQFKLSDRRGQFDQVEDLHSKQRKLETMLYIMLPLRIIRFLSILALSLFLHHFFICNLFTLFSFPSSPTCSFYLKKIPRRAIFPPQQIGNEVDDNLSALLNFLTLLTHLNTF